jgi:hypothetical protein
MANDILNKPEHFDFLGRNGSIHVNGAMGGGHVFVGNGHKKR